MGKIRFGTSGWSYREWKGKFYPRDLSPDDELRYAAAVFGTIEINNTFYSLTDPTTCRQWRDAAPRGFVYAQKGSRYITHVKRLKAAEQAVANYSASGILELGNLMGPVPLAASWQSRVRQATTRRIRCLFCPRTPREAVELAKHYDDRVGDFSYGDGANHRIRHVLEFRHESFLQAETARLAQRHGVALCSSHSSRWPYAEQVTSGFLYLRPRGPGKLYVSSYSHSELDGCADRLRAWRNGAQPEDAQRIS